MRLPRSSAVATLLGAFFIAPAAGAQVPAGGEFRVSTGTEASEGQSSVAQLPTGEFLVVWESRLPERKLRAQRFDARGVAVGPEFLVSDFDAVLAGAAVAASPAGRYAVVWQSIEGNGSFSRVWGRTFDRSGRPRGVEFAPAVSATSAFRPSIANSGAASFVVAWSGQRAGSATDVFTRRFDSAGTLLGPEFLVNTYTTGYQNQAAVSGSENGDFVVLWRGLDTTGLNVFARRFEAGAPVGGELRVGLATHGNAEAAFDPAGNFVVAWQHSRSYGQTQILGQRFAASGARLGSEFVVATISAPFFIYSALAADRSGNFTVVWASDSPGTGRSDILGRRFTKAGVPRGAVFTVNTYTPETQVRPAIADDGVGNFTVTWDNPRAPHTGYDVHGQRFGGLIPAGMMVVDGGNGVVETLDDFTLVTSWRNVTGAVQSFEGRASDVVAPPGLALTLSSDASYGPVADGGVASCGGPCFAGGLAGTRPGGHLDLSLVEGIVPDAQGQQKRWRVHVGETFADVPRTSPFYRFVETLSHHGVTGGCSADAYCPAGALSRAQVAVFVLTAAEGAGYIPPPCTAPPFADVPVTSGVCPWIAEVARRGIVTGCDAVNYCPGGTVSRAQMAVFAMAALDPTPPPPPCGAPPFGDVPTGSAYCPYVAELARRGIVGGCGGGNYCPGLPVTRQEVAVFIGGTAGLALYGP